MSMSTPHGPEYSVNFDRSATWSLTYADADGKVGFCFEPGEEKKKVYLNLRSSVDGKMPPDEFYITARAKLALARTKEYLVSCGYEVLLDD